MYNNYDNNNIFAKILRGEIPCEKVYENEYCLAFKDINPAAKTHVLVIPKGHFANFDDFCQYAPAQFIKNFMTSVKLAAKKIGIEETGYRILSNYGDDANQTVEHFHIHLLGGENLGGLTAKDNSKR